MRGYFPILFILFIFWHNYVHSQNLITNPGFELYNNCPTGRGQILMSPGYDSFLTAIDWIDPTNTSPDYFNRCGTDSSVKLPYLSIDGYHEPHGGDACAGIALFSGNPADDTTDYWSEYLETKLSAPMIAGHQYYVNFYACLTYHGPMYYTIISVDQIGVRFTNNMIDTTSQGPMFYMTGTPDIVTPPGFYVTDTGNWTLISGIYTATGGEQWMTLGRFYSVPLNFITLYTASNPITENDDICYLLIDDVCAIDMGNFIGSDTTLYAPEFPITIGLGKPPGQYRWFNEDTSEQTQVSAPGTYYRERWRECSYYIDTFTVMEMPIDNCLWVPSAFTPNNDGRNDFFGPGNTYCQPAFESFSFIVYNRWGQKVFQTNNAGEKWDGTFNGKLAETGTYFYTIQYDYGGQFSSRNSSAATAPKIIKGDVTLIR